MKEKMIGFFLCVFLILPAVMFSASSLSSSRNIIYVDDDAPDDWYDATHVRTIQEGIDIALLGDTVFVYNGVYYESVCIDKTMTLTGEDKNMVVIDGGGSWPAVSVIADSVDINGCMVRNGFVGLSICDSQGHSISDCVISSNAGIGIELDLTRGTSVSECVISSNRYGVAIYAGSGVRTCSTHNMISNCIVSKNGDGIFLDDTTNNTVIGNTVTGNSVYGILLMYTLGNVIQENNFMDNNRNAFFRDSFYNSWSHNFWDNWVKGGAKIIWGRAFFMPWVNFDWHPAQEPFEVGDRLLGIVDTGNSYDDPLSFRVEFEKICTRVWRINGYATNTFDEDITVRWGCSPCVFAFFYPIPDADLNLLIGQYRAPFFNLKYYNEWFEFAPGQEKLIVSKLFYGVSNRFIYGLSKGYQQYIESWPILPNGEYEVRAFLSPYQNERYEMISQGGQETLMFQYS